jgi:hypothetical protein
MVACLDPTLNKINSNFNLAISIVKESKLSTFEEAIPNRRLVNALQVGMPMVT